MIETDTIVVSLVSSVVGGLVVATANHLLTRYRDKKQQFEKLRIEYLIEAWRSIERASNIQDFTGRDKDRLYDGLESAVASIVLLGNSKEADAARKFAAQFSSGGDVSPQYLLDTLRASLRRDLSLDDDGQGFVFVRMHRDKK